jgi:uncharacterized protein YcgL (UPF0745 family)
MGDGLEFGERGKMQMIKKHELFSSVPEKKLEVFGRTRFDGSY